VAFHGGVGVGGGLITNVVIAELPTLSEAIIAWLPGLLLGATNVAVNEPAELLVTVVGIVDKGEESNVSVICEFGRKLLPVTIIVFPGSPFVGLSEMVGETAVIMAKAVLNESDATTTWVVPVVVLGIANVAENEPALLVKMGVGFEARTDESKLSVIIRLGRKLLPETPIVDPTTPDVGFKVTVEPIRLNVADALPPLSVAIIA